MKSFEYAAPKTLKEATGLLGDKWGEVEILAGGTDLITSLKQGITAPKRVVSLKNISDLQGIKSSKGTLRIGSMTRLRELVANRDVQKYFPALITAAKSIGENSANLTMTEPERSFAKPRRILPRMHTPNQRAAFVLRRSV